MGKITCIEYGITLIHHAILRAGHDAVCADVYLECFWTAEQRFSMWILSKDVIQSMGREPTTNYDLADRPWMADVGHSRFLKRDSMCGDY